MNPEKIKFEFGKAEEKEIEIPKEELKKIDTFFHSKYILLRKREIIKNPEDFVEIVEETLREKKGEYYGRIKEIITKETIKGELPKTKTTPSCSEIQFWRDGMGLEKLEETTSYV